jgi:hypothetical protein
MDDDVVRVELVAEFRLLTVMTEPNSLVIRVRTRGGREHNFGIPRDDMIHVIEQWLIDLRAEAAGRPVTGGDIGHA